MAKGRPKRCPFHSRAYGARCDLRAGHDGMCVTAGDGFAGGWDPRKGPAIPLAAEQERPGRGKRKG